MKIIKEGSLEEYERKEKEEAAKKGETLVKGM